MHRITHQTPRQQGYGSTSSLRNDSLKHTRKHERRREESNQGTKLPGTGGLSDQVGRTVHKGRADCPAGYRGLSAPVPRTVRPSAADHPLNPTEPPVANPEKWTVRGEHADCPPGTRGLSARHTRTVRTLVQRNSKPRWIESKKEEEHEEHTTNSRSRTVRHRHADCPPLTDRAENCSTPKVNSSNPSPNLPNGRSC
jgi:hypothetical protein